MLITNGGDSIDRLDDIGIPYEIFKSLKSKNPISFTSNVRKLKGIVKEKHFDLVHTHHRYTELIAVQAAGKQHKRKFRIIFTALSLVNKKYGVEYQSDKIIAVSHAVKNMLTKKFSVNSDKISLIHNFTDTEEIRQLQILSDINNNEYYNILSVGRFHSEKNFEILLKAMNILKDEKIKLLLIGEGDLDTEYLKYIKKHNLNAEIICPQKNLHKYFLNADLCVLPSLADPFPNFMLQSGLHKKPFIGANVDGIGELIINGRNGLIFKSGNEKELAEKIISMKSHKKLSQIYAENLYNDVIKNYTQEVIIPKIEKLYRSVLKH